MIIYALWFDELLRLAASYHPQEWRNRQTRRLQVPVAAMSCGFKSHLLQFKNRRHGDVSVSFLIFLTSRC